MEHEAKLARVVIGTRALGLLRRWPLGDEAEAEEELNTIAEMLAHRDELPFGEVFHFERLDIADGYAAWSETYDVAPNPLIDAEERSLRPLLARAQVILQELPDATRLFVRPSFADYVVDRLVAGSA